MNSLMEMMGNAYLQRLQKSGHNQFLRLLGSSFYEFMENVDFVHTLAQAQYPKSSIPHFRVDEDSTGSHMQLHYYSRRVYLVDMVQALLKALAMEYFKKKLIIKIISDRQEIFGKGEERRHIIFSIDVLDLPKISDAPPTMVAQTKKHGEYQIKEENIEEQKLKIEQIKEEFGEAALPVNRARTLKSKWRAAIHMNLLYSHISPTIPRTLSIGPREFCEVFPYHIVFDEDMKLKQAGVQIQAIVPEFRKENTLIVKHLQLLHPSYEDFTFINCQHFIDCPHVFRTKRNASDKSNENSLVLRGQMIELKDDHSMLYLCSPYVRSLGDIEMYQMHISDLPHHDLTKYLPSGDSLTQTDWLDVYLGGGVPIKPRSGSQSSSTNSTSKLQRNGGGDLSRYFNDNNHGMPSVSYAMVPRVIGKMMKKGEKIEGEEYKKTTVVFCDIVQFAQIVESCKPNVVVKMLNDLHEQFDQLSHIHDVFKVDVIGDAYVIVAGIPNNSKDDSERAANMALAMLYSSREISSPFNYSGTIGKRCLIRVGMHTGSVIGGVVGSAVPRFTIMGDTVVLASRLESHGVPDKIHLSGATYKELNLRKFEVEERGSIEIRGRGRVITYFLQSNRDANKEMILGRSGSFDQLYSFNNNNNPVDRQHRKVYPLP